jgi:type IV pilus assembly protein PilB
MRATTARYAKVKKDEALSCDHVAGVPFMDLPHILPTRLTHLIPLKLAMELRCAPVGRDQHCLTVAMLDPTNVVALQRLKLATGMTIFPVACDASALNVLLLHGW